MSEGKEEHNMKIVNLKAENLMRLVAVDITPDANLVQITGRNGSGKTSLLNSIYYALAGTKSHCSKPIREGAESATVRLDLGDVIVTREFKRRKRTSDDEPETHTTKVIVQNADGARYQSPQDLLNSMIGSLSFDPLAFMRDDAKTQADTLAQLVGIDLAKSRSKYRAAYDERREYNRDAQQARTAASMISVPDGTPDEPVSVSGLIVELRGAEASNRENRNAREEWKREQARISGLREMVKSKSDEADLLRKRADALDREANDVRQQSHEARVALDNRDAVPEDRDTDPIKDRLDGAEDINNAVANAKRRTELQDECAKAEAKSVELTSVMEASKAGVQAALAKADLPVKGLGIAEGRVTLDGIPLDQASDAKQLEVSCALAMAGNPKLRVIRVRDGSLMDSESLATLARMAEELDHQVWIERVDESGKVGFVIEDGSLKGAEGK